MMAMDFGIGTPAPQRQKRISIPKDYLLEVSSTQQDAAITNISILFFSKHLRN